jgi:hypothetical protein
MGEVENPFEHCMASSKSKLQVTCHVARFMCYNKYLDLDDSAWQV